MNLEEALEKEFSSQSTRAKKILTSWKHLKNCLKSPQTLWYTLKVVICLYLNKSLVSNEFVSLVTWDQFDNAATALVVGKGLFRNWWFNIVIIEDFSETTR